MFCARCLKPIGEREPRTWTVLPGGNIPVPTCYEDRFCYNFNKFKPIVSPILNTIIKHVIPIVVDNTEKMLKKPKVRIKGMDRKYCRPWK